MGAPYDVLVLGAGFAGCTAALWCRRLGLRFAWLEAGDRPGGQLWRIHGAIPDFPGTDYPNGAELAASLNAQLTAAGLAPALGAAATEVELAAGTAIAGGASHHAQTVILATGAATRRLGVPGEAALTGKGVSQSATRDRHGVAGLPVAVVGGGDAAFENALLLAELCPSVTLVHRSARFRARPEMVARVLGHPAVKLVTDAHVVAIEGASAVEGLRIRTRDGEQVLAVAGVFVRIGVGPASEPFAGQLALDADGYVMVDGDQRTSLPHVFAAGDVCSPIYSSLANAAGQGMVAAKAAGRYLAGLSASRSA